MYIIEKISFWIWFGKIPWLHAETGIIVQSPGGRVFAFDRSITQIIWFHKPFFPFPADYIYTLLFFDSEYLKVAVSNYDSDVLINIVSWNGVSADSQLFRMQVDRWPNCFFLMLAKWVYRLETREQVEV